MNKKLSVFIVPDSGRIRQFSISKSVTFALAGIIFAYTAISIVFSIWFFTHRVDASKLTSLSQENRFLSAKLVSLNLSIDSLHFAVNTLADKEKAIRTIFELPEIDPPQRELGIGGPDRLPTDEVLAPSKAAAFQSEAEIDRLIALTTFEKDQFNDIYERLLNKKEDLDCTPSIMPTQGYLIRGYGIKPDPFTGEARLHSGLDISNRIGTHVVATANGTVSFTGIQNGLGNVVVIDHGNGIESVYGHLSAFKVKLGQKVKRGELIALMGNTGYSTGPHLHYEIVRNGSTVNPLNYIYTSSETF